MLVKHLIEELLKLDGDMPVYIEQEHDVSEVVGVVPADLSERGLDYDVALIVVYDDESADEIRGYPRTTKLN